MNCIPSLALSATEGYGNQTFPVTYWILDLIRGTLYLFVVIVITYYAGVLVWKDRDERMDEIVDATPTPDWISYASRLVTLIVMIMLMQSAALLSGVMVQAWHGYHRYQFGLYLYELLVRDASVFFSACSLSSSMCFRPTSTSATLPMSLSSRPTLYLATTERRHHAGQFATRPDVTYSDFFGDAPYRTAWNWFTLYWLLFCGCWRLPR